MGKAETEVSDAIRAYLELRGCIVYRMQSGKFRGAGGWITMNPVGTPDLIAIVPRGRCLAIETKQLGETASEAQTSSLERLNALGAVAVTLDHCDKDELDRLIKEAWKN